MLQSNSNIDAGHGAAVFIEMQMSGAYAGGGGGGPNPPPPPKKNDLSNFLLYDQNCRQNCHYIRSRKKCLQASPRKVSSPPQTKILRTPLDGNICFMNSVSTYLGKGGGNVSYKQI